MSMIKKTVFSLMLLSSMRVFPTDVEKVSKISDSLTLLLGKEEINEAIEKFAAEFNQDQTPLTVICILKGGFVFTADVVRAFTMPTNVQFIRCSSYGTRGTTPGALTINGLEKLSLEGANVLLIDEILDSGQTLHDVYHKILEMNPAKLQTLVLLTKKVENQKFSADYSLFDVEDNFVVGYGIDYKEWFRNLPDIYISRDPKLLD
ncbi:MAG: phosphoribosyltransferase family protein [Candidatus Algichlamydia australiensis]|nr:phosphoribosyltransferase family protein [Chlamydiales bacterium]